MWRRHLCGVLARTAASGAANGGIERHYALYLADALI
jgi:hypothetical protein